MAKSQAQLFKGKKYENVVKQKYVFTDRKIYNQNNPHNTLSHAVSIRITLPGDNIYEQLDLWNGQFIPYNVMISNDSKFGKCDGVTPSGYPGEIKDIGKKREFLFCGMLAIKDKGVRIKTTNLTIPKYNDQITKLHNYYGQYLVDKISDEFRRSGNKIYTLNRIYQIDRDFYFESHIKNGWNGNGLGDKRWEIWIVLI